MFDTCVLCTNLSFLVYGIELYAGTVNVGRNLNLVVFKMRLPITMFLCIPTVVLLLSLSAVRANSNLRCLVCQQVVTSIISAVESEDPRKKIQIGSFRIQPDGTQRQAEVKYAGSELHLHEILETVCDSLNDYAQAKHKETGELALLNLSKDVNKLSSYELVPDPDLNRSLKHYCESFIEEYEDDILEKLNQSSAATNAGSELYLCKTKAGYCKSAPGPSENHLEL